MAACRRRTWPSACLAAAFKRSTSLALYFEDEAETAGDPILNLVPAHRRPTLIARPTASREYRFDVVVQGENETVFFDI